VRRADNLAIFMCRLSENPGRLNSRSQRGLFNLVQEKLYVSESYVCILLSGNIQASIQMPSDMCNEARPPYKTVCK
jgi:hypothetical protein